MEETRENRLAELREKNSKLEILEEKNNIVSKELNEYEHEVPVQ